MNAPGGKPSGLGLHALKRPWVLIALAIIVLAVLVATAGGA